MIKVTSLKLTRPNTLIIFVYLHVGFIHKGHAHSSVGIATSYGLDGPGIESWWKLIFRTHPDRRWGAYLAFCTMGSECISRVGGGGFKATAAWR